MSIWTEEKVAELRRLDAEGLSNAEMAAVLGVEFSDKAVTAKRARMGLQKQGDKLKASMSRGARMTASKWTGKARGGRRKQGRVGGQIAGEFNPSLLHAANVDRVVTQEERDLIAEFLASKPVTVCPGMPAAGAVVPAYIGKSSRAA